jgi:hypothetical protein
VLERRTLPWPTNDEKETARLQISPRRCLVTGVVSSRVVTTVRRTVQFSARDHPSV